MPWWNDRIAEAVKKKTHGEAGLKRETKKVSEDRNWKKGEMSYKN
jgi:hypothetical protein